MSEIVVQCVRRVVLPVALLLSVMVLLGVLVILAMVCLYGSDSMTSMLLAAGAIFGTVTGTVCAIFAASLGATLALLGLGLAGLGLSRRKAQR